MKPIKKIKITEYWECGVPGCTTMHITQKTAMKCIEQYNLRTKKNLLNEQRKKYVDSIICSGIRLDELKLSDFLENASLRTRNCLRVLDEMTVADFLKIPDNEILKIKNFGKKGLLEIKNIISLIEK